MKKIVMLSAAAILGLSSISFSQAEDVIDPNAEAVAMTANTAEGADSADSDAENTDATNSDTENTEAEDATAEDGEAAEASAPPVEEEPIPQDTPQVQKLVALYPKLVQRIQPYGKVCFQGEECDITVMSSGGSANGEPRDGKAVYDAVCQTCHATGLIGAPKIGDAGAWGPRIAKGTDTLHEHAINGFNAMPAKGGADIPDEEVINAVDYMVSQSS